MERCFDEPPTTGKPRLKVWVFHTDHLPIQWVKQLAASSGIAHKTMWPGRVGGSVKTSLSGVVDSMANQTSQEISKFVFFECAVAGTPVLTTDLAHTKAEHLAVAGQLRSRRLPRRSRLKLRCLPQGDAMQRQWELPGGIGLWVTLPVIGSRSNSNCCSNLAAVDRC